MTYYKKHTFSMTGHQIENTLDKQEPSETDHASRIDLFLGSEDRWEMGGHRGRRVG